MSPLPRLLAITPPTGEVALGVVEEAAHLGAPLGLLLREPGASPQALLHPQGRLARLLAAARAADIGVWLSCDVHALSDACSRAADAGLRGLQLRGDPKPERLGLARARWPQGVFGRSVHGVPPPELPPEAPPEPPPEPNPRWDYSVFAPVYAPNTPSAHRKRAAGLEPLAAWCSAAPHVFALGGVTPATASACLGAGAWGLAGISMFAGDAAAVRGPLRQLLATLEQTPTS